MQSLRELVRNLQRQRELVVFETSIWTLFKTPEPASSLTPCSAAVEHGAGRQPGVLQGPQLPGVGRPVQPARTLLRNRLPRPDGEGLGYGQNTPAADHGRTLVRCRRE